MGSDRTPDPRHATVLQSLNGALHAMMAADDRVVVLGEDLADPYGGAFKVTSGLSTRFPDRVLSTPIAESAIVGIATGLALRGMRPVAEIMFGDFVTLAGDQLVNHAAKFRWMYNDEVRVPLVVRAPMGGRRGYGATHSQSLEKHFLGVPGLWVVAAGPFLEPGLVLRQAVLECDDPVLFVESKACYSMPVRVEISGCERQSLQTAEAPFPTVIFRRGGAEALMCCYGGMAPVCAEAAGVLHDREGLPVDLAIFTQLSPTPVSHLAAVFGSRPAVCVWAEEASPMAGWSAEMIAATQEHGDNGSPAIHRRVGAQHTPVPSARALETGMLPQVEDVVQAVLAQF